jgi:molecular chaperone DnaJ
MNLKEAYQTLELAEGSTEAEAKKKYRELTRKYHPDVNKAEDAEAKFKKINEAYECVKNGKGNDREAPRAYGQQPKGWDPFGRRTKTVQLENVEVHLTIDFKESVIGCKREIKYSRKAKCPVCEGEGEVRLSNGCKKCGGKGSTTINRGGMIFVSTCPVCAGMAPTEDCKNCNAEGTAQADVSVHVSVPAGVIDGNVLRLQGMGNFAGTVMGVMDQYTDAFCHITVKPEPGLSIEGRSVVSTLHLSLLDAIRGCKRDVKTIYGNKEIRVPTKSRHNDEVIIPHCGVAGTGDHKVLLDVEYPKNTDKLVGVLLDEVI